MGQLGNGSFGTDTTTPGNVINLNNIRLHGINHSSTVTSIDNETAPTARSGETLSVGDTLCRFGQRLCYVLGVKQQWPDWQWNHY